MDALYKMLITTNLGVQYVSMERGNTLEAKDYGATVHPAAQLTLVSDYDIQYL